MNMRPIWILAVLVLLAGAIASAADPPRNLPRILSIRERSDTINRIVAARFDRVLPEAMRETGFDMWILASNEDDLDPVFTTMVPFNTWFPITQIVVFYDPGPGKPIERLNVSRTDMRGLYQNVWDYNAWDREKKEEQWACLARIVRERNPKRIGINEATVQWAAGSLSVPLKQKLVEAIGPQFAAKLASAEPLATRWLETLLDEELDLFEQVVKATHWVYADTFSTKAITPGFTTLDDLNFYFWQRASDLGVGVDANPNCGLVRHPDDVERYGKSDRTIRPGDLIWCDAGLNYLRYLTDLREWAYVPRIGETDAPAGAKAIMAQANRLQDVFLSQFKAGLTGDQLLANILAAAREAGIPKPRIYSHSIGYFLHEPGPLIGLPWEQVSNPGRGDVKLVPNSCFTAELDVTAPMPEWGGRELRMALEQIVAFTKRGAYFLDGRQTEFHLVK